ncbi:MAG: hypothetical protein EXS17_00140 [Phycisphaerales bacterium]|nr:hypothetical protein [Phycisphaerales bacterium]
MTVSKSVILFTAFEPSGDAHAAPVIAAILRREPHLRIVAWGGPKMQAAGAEMMGRTADDGEMGIPALRKVLAIRKTAQEISRWAEMHAVSVHVPVDSPAANFPMCARLKRRGAKVVHLVAPQIWAWGPWRIRKLRRLTDHVICLLPFEESWFRERGVPATFVGHPVLNDPHDLVQSAGAWTVAPTGDPRLLLLPGSRSIEVDRNAPLLMEVAAAVRAKFSQTSTLIAAANPNIARRFTQVVGELPERTTVLTGVIDRAAAWCDFAVAVSGTVSLDMTRAHKPLIGVYQTSRVASWGAKVMLRSPWRLLPNILAQRTLVPEFVPWAGSSTPIIEAALRFAGDQKLREQVSAGMRLVTASFAGHDPGEESAAVILAVQRASTR